MFWQNAAVNAISKVQPSAHAVASVYASVGTCVPFSVTSVMPLKSRPLLMVS